MAALTVDRMTQSKALGRLQRYLMKASQQIWAGSLVMIDSNGKALPAVAAAGNANVVGVATQSVLSAASGSYYIMVQTGVFLFDAVSIAQANENALMYALDDHTFDETQLANQPVCGRLIEFISATSGWILVQPNP